MKTRVDPPDLRRQSNAWRFNSFVTQEGAEVMAKWLAKPRSRWYIWRLDDGTFDYSAIPNPSTPGHPAELVRTIEVPERS